MPLRMRKDGSRMARRFHPHQSFQVRSLTHPSCGKRLDRLDLNVSKLLHLYQWALKVQERVSQTKTHLDQSLSWGNYLSTPNHHLWIDRLCPTSSYVKRLRAIPIIFNVLVLNSQQFPTIGDFWMSWYSIHNNSLQSGIFSSDFPWDCFSPFWFHFPFSLFSV